MIFSQKRRANSYKRFSQKFDCLLSVKNCNFYFIEGMNSKFISVLNEKFSEYLDKYCFSFFICSQSLAKS